MNIIELNQDEVSAVSGGIAAEIGVFIGGAFASIGATLVLTAGGATKKIDDYDSLGRFGKMLVMGKIAFSPANIKVAFSILRWIAFGNLLGSGVGYSVEKALSWIALTNKK